MDNTLLDNWHVDESAIECIKVEAEWPTEQDVRECCGLWKHEVIGSMYVDLKYLKLLRGRSHFDKAFKGYVRCGFSDTEHYREYNDMPPPFIYLPNNGTFFDFYWPREKDVNECCGLWHIKDKPMMKYRIDKYRLMRLCHSRHDFDNYVRIYNLVKYEDIPTQVKTKERQTPEWMKKAVERYPSNGDRE